LWAWHFDVEVFQLFDFGGLGMSTGVEWVCEWTDGGVLDVMLGRSTGKQAVGDINGF
jgi:hypothetical protein